MKTLKLTIVAISLAFLGGCVSTPQGGQAYKPLNAEGRQVVWHFETPDRIVEAAWQRDIPNARRVRAMFVRERGECHIFTRPPSSPNDLEWLCSAYHELAHCTMGRWHGNQPEHDCGPRDNSAPQAPVGAVAQASRR